MCKFTFFTNSNINIVSEESELAHVSLMSALTLFAAKSTKIFNIQLSYYNKVKFGSTMLLSFDVIAEISFDRV